MNGVRREVIELIVSVFGEDAELYIIPGRVRVQEFG
jgi:hypothetical protein